MATGVERLPAHGPADQGEPAGLWTNTDLKKYKNSRRFQMAPERAALPWPAVYLVREGTLQ